jgi:hypothetical protein
MVSLSRIGTHTIEALISASGYFSKTFSCTARAPFSHHKGHVGENKAKNRIFLLWVLNRSLSESKEFSRVIILFDWLLFLIPKTFLTSTFQLITSNELLPFDLSTTWWTSPKHHRSFGFFTRKKGQAFCSIFIVRIIISYRGINCNLGTMFLRVLYFSSSRSTLGKRSSF